jgi:hypothetical protein
MPRNLGTGYVQSRGYQRQGTLPAWIPALQSPLDVFRSLSSALQHAGQEILGDYGELMDVHVCCTPHPAVLHATCGLHRLQLRDCQKL